MIAVRQVQQAGDRVSKDALQAQPGGIDDEPSVGFLALNWTDYDYDAELWRDIEVIYSWVDVDGEVAKLQRTARYTTRTENSRMARPQL
jgi:hypothetical protein